jgi:outer membrane protein assembly factor BamB
MSRKRTALLCTGLIIFAAACFRRTQSRVAVHIGGPASAALSGTATSSPTSLNPTLKSGLAQLNRGVAPDLAVVPIVINTGAALFPTIMAFLANLAAVLFNPKALARFLRLRWMLVAAITAFLGLIIFVGVPMLRPASVSRAAGKAGTMPADKINWTKVADEIIAQEKLHESAAAPAIVADATPIATSAPAAVVVTPVPGADTPAAAGATLPAAKGETAAKPHRNFARANSEGGMSPAGLTPLWSFQPEDGIFLGMPAVFGKRIYTAANQSDLGGYTGLLASLDYDTGKPIWQIAELNKQALPPFFSSPAVTPDGKYIVIGQGLHQDRNSSLLCFDAATGALHWAVKTTQHIESSPAIFGDMAVVGAGAIEGSDGKPVGDPGYVFAVRISDGKQLWKQAVNDPESSPAIDENGVVYIGSGFNGQAVVALRSASDEELAAQKLSRVVWKTPLAYPITAPVTLSGDLVIVGGGNGDMVHSERNPQGLVVALNRKTGQIVWQQKFEDAVLGSIAVDHGMMICPLRTGEVAALAVADGMVLWRSHVSGSAPVLVGGALTQERAYVVSSDGHLVSFAASTGKLLEKIYLNDQQKAGTGLSLSAPQIIGNRVIVGSETGGLRVLIGTGSAM